MSQLESLLKSLPNITESRMVSNGFAAWVSWKAELNPALSHTLQDYGGIALAQERDQSLWFFFTQDVFAALARLVNWAKMNPLPVFVQVLPAKLLLGYKLEAALSLDTDLRTQKSTPPDDFTVLIHPKAKETAERIPGLEFARFHQTTGLTNLPWVKLQSDQRLPYSSTLGWYVVLRPLGNPLDKNFQSGWREYFSFIEKVLSKMKTKYILHDNFLLFQLESIRQLRTWCTDFLSMVARVKEETSDKYWPTVMAVVEKKGLNFNNDLPKKIRLDWNMLMPDLPHVSYRTAFLLGEGFKIHDVRFSVGSATMDDWAKVSLEGGYDHSIGSMPIEMPRMLVSGEHQHCFYCGLRGHRPHECPSRHLHELQPNIWEKIARMNVEDINKTLQQIDDILVKDPTGGIATLLEQESPPAVIIRAIFEIGSPFQVRTMRAVWRSQGKDYPKGLEQLGPEEGGILMQAYTQMMQGDHETAERTLHQALVKSPLNYQTRSLQGYNAMETDDLVKAAYFWKEAEPQCTSSLQRAFHVFLQARLLEYEGRFQPAQELYKKVLQYSPRWHDALYRQGVCLVKLGFAEQAMGFFEDIISRDPHMFNRLLFDPELERGHIHLLQSMYTSWTTAEGRAQEERQNLDQLRSELTKWFDEDHPFYKEIEERATKLMRLAQIQNYVAFQRLSWGRQDLAQDIERRIEEESRMLKTRFQGYMERLKSIRREAAWFPFPRILVEFNKDFNYCAKNLNWAMRQHFSLAENFKKAHNISDRVQETLQKLESRLRTLKVIRDSTLFILMMGKSFFWLEIAFLLLSLVVMPLSVFYAKEMGYQWAIKLTNSQSWDLQKGIVIVLSVAALGLSALRTAVVFEKRKEKLFEKMEKR